MRINSPLIALSVLFCALNITQAQSQSGSSGQETRPRTARSEVSPRVATPQAPQPNTSAVPTKPGSVENVVVAPRTNTSTESAIEPVDANSASAQQIAPSTIRARIAEAERLLKTRPRQTAITSPALDAVTLAVLERGAARIHLLTVSKQIFLTKGSEAQMTTSRGTPVTLRILRANGVNTAVTVVDNQGRSLVPLTVEFPIERQGVFREMAYYTSAHPALLSADLVKAGRSYVRSMIDLAAQRLREKGVFINPNLVDVAERLCIVEHIDHDRFRLENRVALFDEIYSLYALNQLDTYRYSVSFAGAGGMVQMIPWAYNLERQRHPGVGLMPDFVAGMRNHANALQAMLLYMLDTWNDLAANEDVRSALETKIATPAEVIAAGYNSNAAKLPLYIRRGGAGWRSLIPRETQVYLQIYRTFEGLAPMKSRASVVTKSAA
jgi:hypothetical protein